MRRYAWRAAALAVIWIAGSVLFATESHGDHYVKRHELRCDEAFPCPEAIRGRVDFWIQVFRQWSSAEAVFHDPEVPQRVYSVVPTEAGCSAKRSPAVARELDRLEDALGSIAAGLEQGRSQWTPEQAHLLNLFQPARSSAIRAAAGRIRCQQGNRDRFREALGRFGRYRPMVRSVLRDNGLPADIEYLPFVESGYNPAAYSRVGAAGMWQLMPATARTLGIEINATVDERLDPESATIAAARYLVDSRRRLDRLATERFGRQSSGTLNPFVITSYNYGAAGMRRALAAVGPDFMKVLDHYESPSFRIAVKNFYASFLAARHVARNASTYFDRIPAEKPVAYDTVVLQRPTSITRVQRALRVSEDELKALNPALTRYVWHEWRLIPDGYRLRLPPRSQGWAAAMAQLNALPVENEAMYSQTYRVKRGDTACGIARAFRVSCRDLVSANGLGNKAVIRVGQNLSIPGRGAGDRRAATTDGAASGGSYVVQPGDTACGIAEEFNMKCKALVTRNELGPRAVIRVGQTLEIPGRSGAALTGGQRPSGPVSHVVSRGETACGIAERYDVPCKSVIAANSLGRNAMIVVGQTLVVPGGLPPADATDRARPASYRVVAGDTACQIAERFNVACKDLLAANGLGSRALIRDGQVLTIPGEAGASTGDAAPSSPGTEIAAAEPAPSDPAMNGGDGGKTTDASSGTDASLNAVLDRAADLGVERNVSGGRATYSIVAESGETLGHYADWLGAGGTAALRQLNGLQSDTALRVGQRLRLPISDPRQASRFEDRRHEYHRVLIEEFKERYDIVALDSYALVSGDTPWTIAQKLQVPIWLLIRLNPRLRDATPGIGEELSVPVLRGVSGS